MARHYEYKINRYNETITGSIWDKFRIKQRDSAMTLYGFSITSIIFGIFFSWIFNSFKPLFWFFIISLSFILLGRYFMDSFKQHPH